MIDRTFRRIYSGIISAAILLEMLSFTGCGFAEKNGEVKNDAPAQAETASEKTENAEENLKVFAGLYISEIMTKNTAYCTDAEGSFSDWIEIGNSSENDIPLEGVMLSDGSSDWAFPEYSMKPGEFVLIYADKDDSSEAEWHCSFALSSDDTVCLLTPAGTLLSSVPCEDCAENCSLAFDGGNGYRSTLYPTPGFSNDENGYASWCAVNPAPSALRINEIFADGSNKLGTSDWVEVYNAGSNTVQLSDYFLFDKIDRKEQCRLPDMQLEPGEYYTITCGDQEDSIIGFSIDSEGDTLFLCKNDDLVDFAPVRGIPAGGSFGRDLDGGVWLYSREITPGAENAGGKPMVAETPGIASPDGVFNSVETVSVELCGSGTIYYTTDCTEPTQESNLYAGPISLAETTVIKAVSFEEGKLPSRTAVYSYIINENDDLPVVSLVGTSPEQMNFISNRTIREKEISGNIALYENGEKRFSAGCGIYIYGHASIRNPYKSYKIHFRSVYGDGKLMCDVFGNGIDRYDSLALQKGQDSASLVFRNQLWRDICREMSGKVLMLENKYCALYVDGEYYGLSSLSEDVSRQYVASHTGGSKEQVERVSFPMCTNEHYATSDFWLDIIKFCVYRERNMSDEEYAELCGRLDMDAMIDWLLIEGFSGNVDINSNVEFVRSASTGGKWVPVLFDLDHSFERPVQALVGQHVYSSEELSIVIRTLFNCEPFRDAFIARYSEVRGQLSNEAVIERLDYYEGFLNDAVEKDFPKWGKDPETWHNLVGSIRSKIVEENWQGKVVKSFRAFTGIELDSAD